MSEQSLFWNGIKNSEGKALTDEEKLKFCEDFNRMLTTSPELAKIFFNTHVYNEIVNGVTTRGAHSEGVAIVAENLATKKARLDGKSDIEARISGSLSKALGYMHDLGHTPFGHDGEGALGKEMERFVATPEYKEKRVALYGEDYTIAAEDNKAETMCYEHNETSATIGSRLLIDFCREHGYQIDEQSIQYIKTGILAHSTSRVKEEPSGVEQKALRLADKVAYIPQDLSDLLKQGVLKIDDLSPEEQGLIGLNEDGPLTEKETAQYEALETEDDKRQYLEDRTVAIQKLKQGLRNIDSMPEKKKMSLFGRVDTKVAEMQAEIASKCFVERKGEMQLDGRKETIDVIANYVNKGKTPKDRTLSTREKAAAVKFEAMRDAQKGRIKIDVDDQDRPIYDEIPQEEQKGTIDRAAEEYKCFLTEIFDIDETMATLWVTKAKYQDSFIEGELKRTSTSKDGTDITETLADINRRNDNGWKMKTAFQFFFSNIEQIPQEFRDRYQGEGNDLYTDQQVVSAFIASFTNKGLDGIYNGLLERGLVVSREEAIIQLLQKRPDLDIPKLVSKDMKWQDPQKPDETHKVAANDILELLYEENLETTIVSGKNQNPERIIPQIQHAIAIRDTVESSRSQSEHTIGEEPTLLTSAIDVSKTQVDSKDIQAMVKAVMDRQRTEEIQPHIDKVNKEEGR